MIPSQHHGAGYMWQTFRRLMGPTLILIGIVFSIAATLSTISGEIVLSEQKTRSGTVQEKIIRAQRPAAFWTVIALAYPLSLAAIGTGFYLTWSCLVKPAMKNRGKPAPGGLG